MLITMFSRILLHGRRAKCPSRTPENKDILLGGDAATLPVAGVVEEQGHRVQSAVQLGVVVETTFPLQLHRLFEQSLQAARRQHHGRRQVRCGRRNR